MANVNGSLEAVDCHIHSVRTIWPSVQKLATTQMASSGHLRRCNEGYTSNQCLSRDKDASILSWPTLMGH
eukprot:scaffold4125_cov71-Skeletonema_dohrnii-CCMP3373.AAC.2